jgi:hypothetical protein
LSEEFPSLLLGIKLLKEAGVVGKQLTQGLEMTKHMSELLRVRNDGKGILAKFGNLSPSKLITRA